MSTTLKEQSRHDLRSTLKNPTTDQLQLGVLQRIADATEKISQQFIDLMNERDKYKMWYETTEKENGRLYRQNSRLKANIKRLKNRIN